MHAECPLYHSNLETLDFHGVHWVNFTCIKGGDSRWLIFSCHRTWCHRRNLKWQTLSLSCCCLWQLQEPAVAAEAITATATKDSHHGPAIVTDSQGAAVPCPAAWPLHSLQGWLPHQHWLPSTACEGHFGHFGSAKAVKLVHPRNAKDMSAEPTCGPHVVLSKQSSTT